MFLVRNTSVLKKFVRYKHKIDHWSVQRKKIFAKHKALNHFDDFYKQVFDKSWPSIRQGLLGKPKYMAIVNNFGDPDETKAYLESTGAINVRRLFEVERDNIKERLAKNMRLKSLEQIWKMDETTEDTTKVVEKPKVATAQSTSLESSLKEAELDGTRIVDTRNTLSVEILHHFVPATKIKGKEDYVTESSHYKYYDTGEFKVKIIKEYTLNFPEHLNIYCFEHSNHTDFKHPDLSTTGVFNYYLMDGGSPLPVLALDVKPGMKFLDMCASPGGKSLLSIQTLFPDTVTCNDSSFSRVDRIYRVMRQYLYDFDDKWLKTEKIKITCNDGRLVAEGDFDRILVDVPCTTDRHSVNENDNNMFKPHRVKERLRLPELQCELLVHALKLVKKGGAVVYSTCSLSPIQNDGVVNMALKQIWEETNLEIVVKDLSPALLQTSKVYKWADTNLLRYGHLVVPYLPQNYGPTYFCKLERIK